MADPVRDILIVLFFVLIGGVFAAAEISLISIRESQIAQFTGRRAKLVAKLISAPNRFLAAVQVGVTLAGFISAGFGASSLSPDVAPWFESFGLSESVAETAAFILITLAISFVSLVLGELVPKRLALHHTVGFALVLAVPVEILARLSKPFIALLSFSTNLIVRIFGVDPHGKRGEIDAAELRDLVASQENISEQERAILADVFSLADKEVREIMLPRTEVEFIEADTPIFKAAQWVNDKAFSRYPVAGDGFDDVLGFVHVRDLLNPEMRERSIRVRDIARDILKFPGTKSVLSAMHEMRQAGQHLAIVVDEYGGTAGIVSLEDLVEEVIGEIHDEYDEIEKPSVQGASGEYDVDGLLNLEDFTEMTLVELPDGPYETVAGWAVAQIGRLPEVGDEVEFENAKFEVTKVEARRISRLRVVVAAATTEDAD
jgi:putative hemolysin